MRDENGGAAPGDADVELSVWYRAGEMTGEARVGTGDRGDKTVTFTVVDGVKLFEGDIYLGRVDDDDAQPQGIGRTGSQFRWPKGRIPFVIDPALPNPERVTKAIEHWHAQTSIRLIPRTTETDFVEFVDQGGCFSSVGRVGGRQVISLGSGCGTGSAIHEIGHTVGLWHEQSREDRNKFIEIVQANIKPAAKPNFDQHILDGDDLGNYDFGSIMHYPPTAFTINGQPTIRAKVPLAPGVVMGQRDGLSDDDKAAVRTLYPDI